MASSNPFKNAAQKQKKAPGGVKETPVVETKAEAVVEEKVIEPTPVVTPAPAPVVEAAPVVETATKAKAEPVDAESFDKFTQWLAQGRHGGMKYLETRINGVINNHGLRDVIVYHIDKA